MCGIAGAVRHRDGLLITNDLLAQLAHRGPDARGAAALGEGAIGMCRLRVRDDSTAPLALPLRSRRRDGLCAYNGEIYSSRAGVPSDVTAELDACFDGDGETDGMYALAALAPDGRSVELRRDRFGIKPLYWRRLGGGHAFASEAAPLARIGTAPPRWSENGVADTLAFGRALGQDTIYAGVSSVAPGVTLRLAPSGESSAPPPPLRPAADGARRLRDELRAALTACLAARRPLGLALSGGLDSSILAAELDALGVTGLRTVSLRIPGVADGIEDLRQLGLPERGAWTTWQHHSADFNPLDLPALLADAVTAIGQPTRMTSAPLYLRLASLARDAGIVVLLLGEGADELFGGYAGYSAWRDHPPPDGESRLLAFALPPARRRWLAALLGAPAVARCTERLAATVPLDGQRFADLRALELHLSLEPLLLRADHCLMRHGVEGRTPFLHGLVPSIAAALDASDLIGGGQGKLALRHAWQGRMPDPLRTIAKHPFRMPVAHWFAGALSGWLQRHLRGGHAGLATLGVDSDGLESLLAAALAGEAEAATMAFAVASLIYAQERLIP